MQKCGIFLNLKHFREGELHENVENTSGKIELPLRLRKIP
jgi:hypothetical protein